MTAKELAKTLSGREYLQEITPAEELAANEAGLVVVYGYSDDYIKFRGAIQDEIEAYDGADIYIDQDGLQQEPPCGGIDGPYSASAREAAKLIQAVWHSDGDGPCWTFETDIPHETFHIFEDGEPFCEGIVFRLEDVGPEASHPLPRSELREMEGAPVSISHLRWWEDS